jgi:PhzF family phenazine biosynthesis protein
MHPFYLVNAFSAEPFAGNPAAVLLLGPGAWPEDAWMQGVAAQFNLAETAFVLPLSGGVFGLRWLTPLAEVDLCGHATLATAHVLWQSGRLALTAPALFDTRSGRLTCERQGDGRIGMDFPALGMRPIPAPDLALRALGLGAALAASDGTYLLLELGDESAVRAVKPNFGALSALDTWGTIITAPASGGGDFVSRFFAPRKGVPEDPVTGSAHCRLGPYWGAKLGKTRMEARQLSARGGELSLELRGERILLQGRAVTVGDGDLKI